MKLVSVRLVSRLIALASGLLISFTSNACDMHDQVGFGRMLNFSQGHPFAHRQNLSRSSNQLELNHVRTVAAKVDQNQQLDIGYQLPAEYKNASLRFTYGYGLTLAQAEPVMLDASKGTYTLDFVANKPGKNHILVWMDATKASLPYSKVQRINIDVK